MAGGDATKDLAAAAAKAIVKPFGAVLKLAPEAEDPIWIDGRAAPPKVIASTPDDLSADCVWRGTQETLLRVLSGERALESAYVSGHIAISGDMSVMTRLALEGTR